MRFWLKTLAWLVAMLAGLELASRFVLGHAPRTRIDKDIDRLPYPNEPVVQSSEGWFRGRTNELGHLDAPMPSTLPPNGILVIGDSLTEGRQVAMSSRFTDLLGEKLGRRVFNVGHTGWSPLNAIAFMKSQLPKFAPSTVLVQVTGGDLEDIVTKKRPHLVEKDGKLDYEFPKREKKGLAKKINAVKETLSRSALLGNLIVRGLMVFTNADEDGGAARSCDAPTALAVRSLPWIVEQLKSQHHDVRLFYLPVLDYHAGCVDKCAIARQLWHSAADTAHVPLVDVTDAMCRRYHETKQPLNGFWNTLPGVGHMNWRGHEVVADELAASLRGTAAQR